MNTLLRTIISSSWAIDEAYALSVNPLMQKVLSGETIDLSKMLKSSTEVEMIAANYNGLNIAVVEIENVLMREDQMCGGMGTESIDALLKELASNPSVGAVILSFNSPGGQSEYIENVAKTIGDFPKPIVSWVSGSCASAAYWLASKSDAIFTSAKTDRVGSIGTMISYYKSNPEAVDQPRYLQVNVYASRSIDKNSAYEDMLDGEYERIIKEVLDPINAVFIEDVQTGRTQIDESTLTGKMYYSFDSQKLGLTDGIKSFDEVVAFVTEQIANSQNQNTMGLFSKNKKPQPIKNELFSSILERDVNDGEILSVDDLQKVQSHIEGLIHLAPAAEAADLIASVSAAEEETPVVNIADVVANAVSESMKSLNQRFEAIETALEIKPAATLTVTAPVSTDEKSFEDEPWNDPNRSYNKLVDGL
jgi:ClpP class serine protease